MPSGSESLKPTITVVGVGGAGGNAVNNMINANLEGARFVVANTDAQALESAVSEHTIQLGANITQGLGAGAHPDVGRASAEEAADEIMAQIQGSHMVFITAGMGGGTGTGAAPVVARMAKEQGILTVAVVTKPFHFEGTHRMKLADMGLEELQKYVDTMIVIPNQNLFRIANDKTTFADAFRMADEVLHSGVRGVTDLMVMPGLINLDFSDIRTVMREMGKAMMGTGEGEGDRRAIEAAEAAISNPLLDDVSMKGARGVLINVTGGYDMTLFEVDEAANRIRDEVDPDANIIFGSTFNQEMEGKMRVSVVATGIDHLDKKQLPRGGSDSGTRGFSQRGNAEKETSRESAKATASFTPAKPVTAEREEPRRVISKPVTFTPKPKEERISSAPLMMQEEEQVHFEFSAQQQAERHSPTRLESSHNSDHESQSGLFAEESRYQTDSKPASISPAIHRQAAPSSRQEIRRPVAVESRQPQDAYEADAEEDSGFLRRMTSRFAPAAAAEDTAPRRVEVSPARAMMEEEEDYLEIPAFLRRQAN